MPEKTFDTRVKLKYDNLTNWLQNNPILLKGEIALVEIPNDDPTSTITPTVLTKIGDGIHNFSNLNWTSSLASDVYSWAKVKNLKDANLTDSETIGQRFETIDATKAKSSINSNGAAYKAVSIPMGRVDNTSTATNFTATIDGITDLRDGICIWLYNGIITSATGFTININGLGAKPCYSSLAKATQSTTIFNVNYTLLLIYNSTRIENGCWDIVYGIDTNTTYTPYSLGFGYGICTTATTTTEKVASISSSYKLVAGSIISIKFTNNVSINATLNINAKGAKEIYYRGNPILENVIKAGDTATFIYSTYYHLIAIDRDIDVDLTKYATQSWVQTEITNALEELPYAETEEF